MLAEDGDSDVNLNTGHVMRTRETKELWGTRDRGGSESGRKGAGTTEQRAPPPG